MRNQCYGSRGKEETLMAKKNGVSGKTHTKQQLDDYANQHNPNNKAYKARLSNDKATKNAKRKHNANKDAKRHAKSEAECGVMYPLDWFCYSNPYDFD